MMLLRPRGPVLFALAATLLASFLAAFTLTTPAPPAYAAAEGGEFVPVPATRIVDTSTGLGGSTVALGEAQWRDYQILGVAGIPTTGVTAVVVDVAAMSLTGATASNLRIYPSGGALPDTTILRFEQGSRPRSNTVITKVGSNGKIRVYNSTGAAHFNLDVQGYFTTSQDGSGFQPITPTRMVSTGTGVRIPQEQLAPHATYDIQIAGTTQVPDGATAVFANVKVSGAEVAGGIRLSQGGVSSSAPVTLNYQPNVYTDSGVTIKLSSDGRLRVTNTSSTATVDIHIDVHGYFLNGPEVSGGTFTPLDGARIYDTANTSPIPAGGTRTVTVASLGGLPAADQIGAVALTLFVRDWNSTGSVRLYPADVAEPGASNVSFNINSDPSYGLSTTSITRVSAAGAVKITNTSSGPVRVLLNAQGWFSKLTVDLTLPQPPTVTLTPCLDGCPADSRIADTLTPTLGASSTDPDGDELTFNWEVRDAVELNVVATGTTAATSGTQSEWTIPAGLLQPEGLYQFRSGASDATSPIMWSSWTEFGVDPDEAPFAPADLTMSPCVVEDCSTSVIASRTPVLAATVDDADTSVLEAQFQVRDGEGAVVASGNPPELVPAGGLAAFQVPTGTLQNSTGYEFRVSGNDGTTTTWSDWKPFSVEVAATVAPPSGIALTTCEGECNLWHSNWAGATFSATVAASGPVGGVTVRFEVRSDAYLTDGQVAGIQPGASASWTLPAGQVSSGVHEIRAGVVHGSDVAWTGWQPFTTTVPLDTTLDEPVAQVGTVDEESEIDPTPTPEPAEDVADNPDTTPYTDGDLATLESEVEADRQRAVVQGVSEDSEFLVSRAVPAPSKYAPISYIHPLEDRFPLSAATFINHSQLEWCHDGCNDHDLSNNPSATKMGSGDYSHQSYWSACINHTATRWNSTDKVSPFKSGGPWGAEGMNLDLADSYRDGQGFGGGEPVYYTYEPRRYIQYWFHFGESSVPNSGPNLGKHEGDWEHIAILLNSDNAPVRVKYFYHHESCQLPWSMVPKIGTHPRLMTARNSHGNYPPGFALENTGGPSWTGTYWEDRVSTTGPKWYANNNLQNARSQAWYGYAGVWGEMGRSSNNTGPWGPNPYREGVPDFGVERCGTSR